MSGPPRSWNPKVTPISEIESMTSFRLSEGCHKERDKAFDWKRSVLVPPLIFLSMIPAAFAISPLVERFPVLPLMLGLVIFVMGAVYIHKTNVRQRNVLRRMSDEYSAWIERMDSESK